MERLFSSESCSSKSTPREKALSDDHLIETILSPPDLSSIDSEEDSRRYLLREAAEKYETYWVPGKYMSPSHFFSSSFAAKQTRTANKEKNLRMSKDKPPSKLQAIRYSDFIGSPWHRNAIKHFSKPIKAIAPLNSGSTDTTESEISEEEPCTNIYAVYRYIINPCFGSHQWEWSSIQTQRLLELVTENVYLVSNLSTATSALTESILKHAESDLQPSHWELMGRHLKRPGFACYVHFKHAILFGSNLTPWTEDEMKLLLALATKFGISFSVAEDFTGSKRHDLNSDEYMAKFSKFGVWDHISDELGTGRSSWQCFSCFRRLLLDSGYRTKEYSSECIVSEMKDNHFAQDEAGKPAGLVKRFQNTSQFEGTEQFDFSSEEGALILEAHYRDRYVDYASLCSALRRLPRKLPQISVYHTKVVRENLRQGSNYNSHASFKKLRQEFSSSDDAKILFLFHIYGTDDPNSVAIHFHDISPRIPCSSKFATRSSRHLQSRYWTLLKGGRFRRAWTTLENERLWAMYTWAQEKYLTQKETMNILYRTMAGIRTRKDISERLRHLVLKNNLPFPRKIKTSSTTFTNFLMITKEMPWSLTNCTLPLDFLQSQLDIHAYSGTETNHERFPPIAKRGCRSTFAVSVQEHSELYGSPRQRAFECVNSRDTVTVNSQQISSILIPPCYVVESSVAYPSLPATHPSVREALYRLQTHLNDSAVVDEDAEENDTMILATLEIRHLMASMGALFGHVFRTSRSAGS